MPAKEKMDEPTPGNIQEEGFINAFYQPRSFSALLLLVVAILYLTIYQESFFISAVSSDASCDAGATLNATACQADCIKCEDCGQMCGDAGRIKAGLLLAGGSFLLYCGIQLRDSHLLRPHPAVWRLAHGAGLLYFLLLTYLMCQDYQGIISFLKLFDRKVGEEQVEKSYGADCRLYAWDNHEDPWINIKDQVIDRFVIAHFLGWTLKALILRDWGLMWIASVLFEVLEVTFQHMWPNFNECYWDHLILDIFGCNLGGMIFGMYLVKWLGTHQFDWTGHQIDSIQGSFGKMKRVALQFTPYSFETYRWQVFSTWRRAVIGVSVLFILLLGEMNAFFIKSTFKIPIESNINLYRLSFWVLMTYMSVFEFHHFAAGKSRRVGVNSWLAGSLVSLETILVVKHIHGESLFTPEQLIPQSYIVHGWVSTLVLFLFAVITKSLRRGILWWGGAQEVIASTITEDDDEDQDTDESGAKPRTISFHSIDPQLKGYVRAGLFLDKVFKYLTYALPVPLVIVLIIDCLRTVSHPTPKPNDSIWFNFLFSNISSAIGLA